MSACSGAHWQQLQHPGEVERTQSESAWQVSPPDGLGAGATAGGVPGGVGSPGDVIGLSCAGTEAVVAVLSVELPHEATIATVSTTSSDIRGIGNLRAAGRGYSLTRAGG